MNISLLSVNNHVPHSLHVSPTCCCSIPAITTLTLAPHHNTSDQIVLTCGQSSWRVWRPSHHRSPSSRPPPRHCSSWSAHARPRSRAASTGCPAERRRCNTCRERGKSGKGETKVLVSEVS